MNTKSTKPGLKFNLNFDSKGLYHIKCGQREYLFGIDKNDRQFYLFKGQKYYLGWQNGRYSAYDKEGNEIPPFIDKAQKVKGHFRKEYYVD